MLKKLLFVSCAALACSTSFAFINPNFSPVHLMEQSETVLAISFDKPLKDGKAEATVVKALKGEKPAKPLVFDLGASAFPAQGKEVEAMIADGAREAMLFTGQFGEGGGGAAAEGAKGMLHVCGMWVVFNGNEDGSWDLEKIDSHMMGTWAGSTDMLRRAIDYILSDPDADVPVRSNAEWDTAVKFATIEGKVTGAIPVECDGKLALYVACDKGDMLFPWKDGKLVGEPQDTGLARAKTNVPIDLAKVSDVGAQGAVFYADFDGDGLPDILQMFERAACFYKGTAPGKFAEPVKTQLALGKGKSTAQIGDYDADGLLDVFCSAEDGNHLWHNLGGGKFVNRLSPTLSRSMSGEIDYISKPGGVDGMTGDVNNDGRQDILVAYAEMAPHIFFDRGFRSFGHAHEIDLAEQKLLEEASKGQQACALADFTGDGAQDLVIVLTNGDAWLFPRRVVGKALSVSVSLGKDAPDPLLVVGYAGKRCLGAWNVTRGGNPAFFGLTDAGTVTLKWKLPTGEEKSAKVDVIDRAVRYVVAP